MNAEDFRATVVPLYRKLYTIAFSLLRDSEEASDTVQDTMIRLWEMADSLDGIANIEAFAATTTRRICIDRLRIARPSPSIDDISHPPAPPDSDDTADDVTIVERIIETLPSSQQTVIRLSAYDDRSNDEIARLTGISQSNVRQLLSRARKRIKELFNTYNSR